MMNRRRRFSVFSALAVTLVLLTGCVEAPFDEAQLQTTEEPGVAAAPLNNRQARRVAHKARQAKVPRKQRQGSRGGQQQAGGGSSDGEGQTGGGGGSDGGTGGETGGAGDGASGGGTEGSKPAQPSVPVEPPAPFRVVSRFDDPAGDASGQSPGYADIRNLLIETNGSAARITVSVAEQIPQALADGEVQGVGIDFYRSDDEESDFQLFLDGGSDGWLAYIQRPAGVDAYPGRFALGGRVFVLTLPWSALGGTRQARVGMFIDWSERRTVLNAAGNDRAPEDGRLTVDPR